MTEPRYRPGDVLEVTHTLDSDPTQRQLLVGRVVSADEYRIAFEGGVVLILSGLPGWSQKIKVLSPALPTEDGAVIVYWDPRDVREYVAIRHHGRWRRVTTEDGATVAVEVPTSQLANARPLWSPNMAPSPLEVISWVQGYLDITLTLEQVHQLRHFLAVGKGPR